jgi:asparagine synthase (glutamine-hydrolysing)
MCGIAGFFGLRAVDPLVPAEMLAQIKRRGPDAQHAVTWDGLFQADERQIFNALLHARLSIIDPRPEADQPMSNERGDIWICYNGEVFDWQSDAGRLREQGFVFRTRSDTEFILLAYEAWGVDCVAKLRGMFAIVIVDLRRQKVLLIRDRMGIKPLVYYHHEKELAFASTVRSLLPFVPATARRFSEESIDAYLAHRYIPAPRTAFSHIARLENGHYLSFDLTTRELSKHRYWHARAEPGDWLATLDHAVRIRTVADRPLGLFLSGGIDSSVIASRLAAQDFRNFHSFTAAFPGSKMDEAPQAKAVADLVGLPNHAVAIGEEIAGDFDRIVADLDEPFADPSSFPLWYLSRETTRHVKVVLSGDGGDELLAGYKRYDKHLRTAWRGQWRLSTLRLRPSLDSKHFSKLAAELSMSWLEAYTLRFSGFSPGQRLYLQPGHRPGRFTYWRSDDARPPEPLLALLAVDMQNYLPEYILRKADLCTMAHGLELRVPLLDHHWYQNLLALPAEERFTKPPKLLFERSCRPCASLGLFRQKKRGFNPPLQQWLLSDLAARLPGLGERLSETTARQLDPNAVNAMVERYKQGARHMAEQILQLLILDESLRQLRVSGGQGRANRRVALGQVGAA